MRSVIAICMGELFAQTEVICVSCGRESLSLPQNCQREMNEHIGANLRCLWVPSPPRMVTQRCFPGEEGWGPSTSHPLTAAPKHFNVQSEAEAGV